MSLTLSERIELVEKASAERARDRLREADDTLTDGIQWVMCDCDMCRDRRYWERGHPVRPLISRESLRNAGILLLGIGVALAVMVWR
jgi:hypothetical protein